MWQLNRIEAKNLCAFEELQYDLVQHNTTLIFGQNLDNDSQNSNGSGKSALIEAIAISLTGENLRKVNMDEIINDAYDTATITAFLFNPSEKQELTIERTITRKKPQTVKITLIQTDKGVSEDIVQSGITEYNKYILDTIGLSKDDIFANFILTTSKYRSFLSSSDREKKEIINRFSNGIMVDESIEALHNDIDPVQDEVLEADKNVANCTGQVSALENEIERAIQESANKSENKKRRIEEWGNEITTKRAEIRRLDESLTELDKQLDDLFHLDTKMVNLEQTGAFTQRTLTTIQNELAKHNLEPISDYIQEAQDIKDNEKTYKKQLKETTSQSEKLDKKLTNLSKVYKQTQVDYKTTVGLLKNKDAELKSKLKTLQKTIEELDDKEQDLYDQRTDINAAISVLHKQLADIIECPKCQHKFTLAGDVDLTQAQKNLEKRMAKLKQTEDTIASVKEKQSNNTALTKEVKLHISNIDVEFDEAEKSLRSAKANMETIQDEFDTLQRKVRSLSGKLDDAANQLDNLYDDMFDETFDRIGKAITKTKSQISQGEINISTLEGAIKSYEESIKDIKESSETDIIASLKESKDKYIKSLEQAIVDKEKIEAKLFKLKTQEATFMEFKTHLANTKISAISQITNDFLETIGSDIKIALSGYTKLKSGKIRDKISVSLMRDGVDGGSFNKFSKGEQARVELACILAMHKLVNMNCQDGRGLNLLVIDEILDATDEQGLAHVFKALNETQTTSLVVSHGNVAENYPNRLVVTKQNGKSFI